ncbi:MAG: LytTR family DNA-binding domain-containing protein [Lachnospiraceae bacterium]|jgi:DNA-binding LytR/AlgR family response regulator|nr:LytTR family DNA-binding domain-containing protein [Lachnospiraceae bacterium]
MARAFLKIAICDDNTILLKETERLTNRALSELPHKTEVFSCSEDLLRAAAEDDFSIAVLDIELSGNDSGIDLGQSLLQLCPECRILFLTSYDKYAQDVYDVEHTGFVLKSEMDLRLPAALRRTLEKISKDTEKNLAITTAGRSILFLSQAEIIYMERRLRTTYIHMLNRTEPVATSENMDRLLTKLTPGQFIQCHKSYAVSWKYVDRLTENTIRMKNGAEIPVSRKYGREVRESLLEFSLSGREKSDGKGPGMPV